jgi:ubiquinone/menaquinone biosynthesis C-methylase UbiE
MLTVDYDRLGLKSGERLLDLGCGAGRHAYEALRRGASVIALDANEQELKNVDYVAQTMIANGEVHPEASLKTVHGNALDLPFEAGYFDRIIASEVLEHISDDVRAMEELNRVLAPAGTMAVTVPRFLPELINWSLSDKYHSVEGGHVRIYRRSQLALRLKRAGFDIAGYSYTHGLHSPYWWLKSFVGLDREHVMVRAYHNLLVREIVENPPITRFLGTVLDPLIGKSMVVYLSKRSA